MTPAWAAVPAAVLGAYLYWRYVWFFRNPPRTVPLGDHLVSPADGRVVYARINQSREDVILLKEGLAASLTDILRQDVEKPKIHLGIFMSPFDVHYNRVPLAGRVEAITHHPPAPKNRCMAQMHWRTLLHRPPFQKNSVHVLTNERLVTRLTGQFKGIDLTYYLVQIAGKSVHGIDSYTQVGAQVNQGDIFGMIRIGSQVDLVVPCLPDMDLRVQPGGKVRAGESILIS